MAKGNLIRPLHGLRGIAALSVVYAHGGGWFAPATAFAGSMGVALFFVLSGFLMAFLYLPQRPDAVAIGRYVRARVARVYPLFAALLVVSGIATFAFQTWPFPLNVSEVIVHFLGAGGSRTIWTISTELQFYAVFVFIWIGYWLTPSARDAVFVAAILASIALLWSLGFSEDRIALTGYFQVFAVGMLAAIAYRRYGDIERVQRYAGYLLLPMFAFWLVMSFVAYHHWGNGRFSYHQVWLMAGIGMLVFAACAGARSWFGRVLGTEPLVWLGEVSFGIYLLHRPVMWALSESVPASAGLPYVVKGAILVAVILAVAHLANVIIERPFRDSIRRWSWRPRSPAL